MRVLRAAFAAENTFAARRAIIFAIFGKNKFLRLFKGFRRNANRVGTHIGDQGHSALAAQLYSFIKALGDVHGAFGGVAQALVGALLERGGNERRLRVFLAFLFLNFGNNERLALDSRLKLFGRIGIADDRFFAVNLVQVALERLPFGVFFQPGVEQPVLFRHKRLPFLLAVHNQAQGHGLHAPGRDAPFHFLPKQRRNFVAHQAVKNAPGLLRVKQVGVKLTRVFNRLPHRAGGDFVELNPLYIVVFRPDKFGHMPGDRLALAVGVGRKIHGVGLGGGRFQPGHHFFLARNNFILRSEIVRLVHPQSAGRQIAYMPHAGFHGKVIAQKFADGLNFGRGLNYYQ